MTRCAYDVLSVYRDDPQQVGDRASVPAAYAQELGLPWLAASTRVDITSVTPLLNADIRSSVVVLGGGGLTFDDFQENIQQIVRAEPLALFWWGAGHNIHVDPSPYRSHGRYENLTKEDLAYPGYLRIPPFSAIGVRDPESSQIEPSIGRAPFRHVPCASVMQPSLDDARLRKPDHDMVAYVQKDPLMPLLPGVPTMSNATEHQYNSCGNGGPADRYVEPAGTAAAAVDFLGKGRVCLTNSYHGALWAQMLEKPVIVVDGWSTKFYRLPIQQAVLQVSFEEVRTSLNSLAAEAIERATRYADELADLLDASRQSNMDFAQTVEDVLLGRGVLY